MDKNKTKIQKVIKSKLDNKFPTLKKIRMENHHKSHSRTPKTIDLSYEDSLENDTPNKKSKLIINHNKSSIPECKSFRKFSNIKNDIFKRRINSLQKNYHSNTNTSSEKKISERLILKQQLKKAQEKINILEQERDKLNKVAFEKKNNNILINQIQSLKNKVESLEIDNKQKLYNQKQKNNIQIISNKNNNNKINDINIKEKIYLFIKILKNYGKKLNSLLPLCSINTDAFDELKQTIEQYNNVINSEKIKQIFFFNSEQKDLDSNIIFTLSEFEPKTFDLYSKFQCQIEELQKNNEYLNKKVTNYEKVSSIINYNEMENLKTSIKKLQNEKDKLENNINIIQKLNKELNNNLTQLKEIEEKYYSQQNTIKKLNEQIENLNSELSFKETTINYLENLVQNMNNSYQFKTKDNLTNIEDNNYNTYDTLNSKKYLINPYGTTANRYETSSFYSLKKDSISSNNTIKNNKVNNIEVIKPNNFSECDYIQKLNISSPSNKNLKTNDLTNDNQNENYYQYSSNKFNNNDVNEFVIEEDDRISTKNFGKKQDINNNDNNNHKNENLQTEIDQLDLEIDSLKTKLKSMITK